ncbi:hypothetical protein J1N35_041874 [Gossypium stocksii]|uniref:Uncharacterized protein n=1 Tax=Gossypium stocksii TaxID=47602 RepID=A0A9D3UGB8_9ROSI|nr:hypothetical protein J1N35_041874 [Gossypium stocksii]
MASFIALLLVALFIKRRKRYALPAFSPKTPQTSIKRLQNGVVYSLVISGAFYKTPQKFRSRIFSSTITATAGGQVAECTPRSTSSTINPAYPHSVYHQSIREDDMEGMLRDAFNMHSHGLQSFPPDFIASDDCNIGGNTFTETGRSVPDEEPNGEVVKFY